MIIRQYIYIYIKFCEKIEIINGCSDIYFCFFMENIFLGGGDEQQKRKKDAFALILYFVR